jgi:DNA polymerase (family 10)
MKSRTDSGQPAFYLLSRLRRNAAKPEQLGCNPGKRYEDMPTDAAFVAKTLRELAQRMELEGGNPYRARAYARAAENLSLSPEPLNRLIKEGRLTEIPGIGDAIAAVITKLYETGQHAKLEAMREKAPEGVLSMLRIPGLVPAQRRLSLSAETALTVAPELCKRAQAILKR